MSNGTNVPLTVQSAMSSNAGVQVVIGNQSYYPSPQTTNAYWFLVVDRTNLNPVVNVMQSDSQTVPPSLTPYLTTQYMMVVVTNELSTLNVPQGALFDFLDQNGAGAQLKRLIQVNNALSCGEITNVSYVLVSTLGNPGPLAGFEGGSISQADMIGVVLTLALMPVQIGSQTYYTPVQLQD